MELNYPLILDGATGTRLQQNGFQGSICAEQWTLEHPEVILAVQKGYVDAGTQVLYTPTFGANRVKLEAHGIFNRVEEYNLRLAALSKEAASGKALVAGDLAPTGLFLYPLGDTSFEELVEIYTEQAAALEKAGVDLFVIETMMTVAEARAAVLAVRSVSEKPVFVSFTCDANGRTLTGSDVKAALQILQGMEIDAFGLNCSVGPEEIAVQAARLHEIARVPLLVKPNAGVPEIQDGVTVYHCPPEVFAQAVPDLAACGVCIFGGCCGTDEGHIRALKNETAEAGMVPPDPKYTDLLPCATEKEVFFLDPATEVGEPVSCDGDLEEKLEEAMASGVQVVCITIASEKDLDSFADVQYMITKPLCFACEDAALLEQALRLYQGRALYDGNLPEEKLLPLVRRYGLLI